MNVNDSARLCKIFNLQTEIIFPGQNLGKMRFWLFSIKERVKGRFLKKTIICVSQKLSTFAENKLASVGRKSLKQKKNHKKLKKGEDEIFKVFSPIFSS